MRHGDHAIADLEPRRRCSIDNHANCLMPEFCAGLAGPPRLPLGAHRRDQHFDRDDIAGRLRLRLFGYQRLAQAGDFYA
jgi:hypothetical protein